MACLNCNNLTPHISIDLKGLAPDQQEAFQLSMAHPVFILTGAPGTGKTYLLRRIIEQFTEWNSLIALAAPTGKAAKRMTEIIGMPAMTIHRLLGPEPRTFKGELYFGFTRGVGSPIPADLLVVDEFSMVDISLAASLFRAVARGARVLIVGDHYQLPSVGPGAVLRDLLAAGVPSYELTEIKRNTGDIVKACHAIKDGKSAEPSPHLDPDAGLNFRHIEESDPFEIQDIIRDLVTKRLPMRGYDPVWDVQVLSPMNERTALSCLDLNVLLQGTLNIHPPVPGTPFRVGDKIIQLKNQEIDGEFVVNGDLGEVKEINESEIKVNFLYPDRLVRIKRKAHNLRLAYCISIHRMQGSEGPVIIIPVHSCFGGFFNRELLYTALSRAQDIAITIGEWHAFEAATGRVGNVRRITRLAKLIKGE
jgi:exodeoxyribonuclease V alpha subunit